MLVLSLDMITYLSTCHRHLMHSALQLLCTCVNKSTALPFVPLFNVVSAFSEVAVRTVLQSACLMFTMKQDNLGLWALMQDNLGLWALMLVSARL